MRCPQIRQTLTQNNNKNGGGPKLGFEPRQKAPQASRLPGYLTSAAFSMLSDDFAHFEHGLFKLMTNALFSLSEDLSTIVESS